MKDGPLYLTVYHIRIGIIKDNMDTMLEKVPPFSWKGYARTFQHMQNHSTQYEVMSRMARKMIVANGFDKEPIRMLR